MRQELVRIKCSSSPTRWSWPSIGSLWWLLLLPACLSPSSSAWPTFPDARSLVLIIVEDGAAKGMIATDLPEASEVPVAIDAHDTIVGLYYRCSLSSMGLTQGSVPTSTSGFQISRTDRIYSAQPVGDLSGLTWTPEASGFDGLSSIDGLVVREAVWQTDCSTSLYEGELSTPTFSAMADEDWLLLGGYRVKVNDMGNEFLEPVYLEVELPDRPGTDLRSSPPPSADTACRTRDVPGELLSSLPSRESSPTTQPVWSALKAQEGSTIYGSTIYGFGRAGFCEYRVGESFDEEAQCHLNSPRSNDPTQSTNSIDRGRSDGQRFMIEEWVDASVRASSESGGSSGMDGSSGLGGEESKPFLVGLADNGVLGASAHGVVCGLSSKRNDAYSALTVWDGDAYYASHRDDFVDGQQINTATLFRRTLSADICEGKPTGTSTASASAYGSIDALTTATSSTDGTSVLIAAGDATRIRSDSAAGAAHTDGFIAVLTEPLRTVDLNLRRAVDLGDGALRRPVLALASVPPFNSHSAQVIVVGLSTDLPSDPDAPMTGPLVSVCDLDVSRVVSQAPTEDVSLICRCVLDSSSTQPNGRPLLRVFQRSWAVLALPGGKVSLLGSCGLPAVE